MAELTPPEDLEELLLPQPTGETTFETVRILTPQLWSSLAFLGDLGQGATGEWGPDMAANVVLLPASERGSMTLGAASADGGARIGGYDALFYDQTPPPLGHVKFLNVLEEEVAAALAAAATDAQRDEIRAQARIDVMNLLDTVKLGMLHQDVLDAAGIALDSFAVSGDDARAADQSPSSINSIAEGQLDDFAMRGNAVFREVEALRGRSEGSIDAALVGAFPDSARIIYPGGAVSWTSDVRVDIITRDAVAVHFIDSEDAAYDIFKAKALEAAENGVKDAIQEAYGIGGGTSSTIKGVTSQLASKTNAEAVGAFVDLYDLLSKDDWALDEKGSVEAAKHIADIADAYLRIEAASGGVDVKDLKAPSAVKLKAGIGIVNNMVSLYNMQADYKKYGGFTPEFFAAKAVDFISGAVATKVAEGVLWVAGAAPPLGTLAVIGAGSYFAYQAVKDYARTIIAEGEPGSDPVFYAEFVLAVFEEFEKEFAPQIEIMTAVIEAVNADLIEPIVDDLLPEIITASGESAAFVFDEDQWLVGTDAAFLVGDDADNVLIHDGHGEVRGGEGGDILLGWTPDIGPNDERMVLNGEEGDDWIFVVGGENATVVGGQGRDLVMNWSYSGLTWGDDQDGAGGDDDTFWWAAGQFIMDAEKQDRLQMFGVPLVGGTNSFLGDAGEAVDWFIPWVRYGFTTGGQLIANWGRVSDSPDLLKSATIINNFEFGGASGDYVVGQPGTLGMIFRIWGEDASDAQEVGVWFALWGHLITYINVLWQFVKNIQWQPVDDPLVLDLDGDGIENSAYNFGGVHFDINQDGFAEKTGWVGRDDGFLVWDKDGNRRIEDTSEMFGGPDSSGFAELAALDGNEDGVIDAADDAFDQLEVWRDLNQDGITDEGELFTLSALEIASLNLAATETNETLANGNVRRAVSSFSFADGVVQEMSELIFDTNPANTIFRGAGGTPGLENGYAAAPWSAGLNLSGYGRLADLAVAAGFDPIVLAEAQRAAAAMTATDLDGLIAEAQDLYAVWSASLVNTAELTPMLLSQDGATLLDYGVWDDAAGIWRLHSGADVVAAGGAVIAAPTLSDVLAMAPAEGVWTLQQTFSPQDREDLPENRTARPYLVEIVGARPSILDYGIEETDAQGTYWRLATGADVLDEAGAVIARPTLEQVLAQAPDAGEWKTEVFGASDWEDVPFDRMAVTFTDGKLTNFSVQVTDQDGAFHVWINNLRRALELQEQNEELGTVGSFDLRNYELVLDGPEPLKDLDNTEDSHVYARLLSPTQLRFAMASYGTDFQPDALVAEYDADGRLHYGYDPATMLAFYSELVDSYYFQERAYAVRLAVQDGLSDFFDSVEYDVDADKFRDAGNRMLTPVFEKMLQAAPAARDDAVDYLTDWARIMDVIYADYLRPGGASRSEKWLVQMLVAASENVPSEVELLKLADIFGAEEEKFVLNSDGLATLDGTNGKDIFVLTSETDELVRGGLGSDLYIVGRDWGNDRIQDHEPALGPRAPDFLRFAHLNPEDVFAWKDGIDLVIEEVGTDNVLRIIDQFDGEFPGIFGGDFSPDTEMVEIVFADGTSWRELEIAEATSHPLDTDDLVLGTPAMDVLAGGLGNDILRGGRDSDLYIFQRGWGLDRIEDRNDNIMQEHVDFIRMEGDITLEDIEFERIGDSHDLTLHLLDENDERTGDALVIDNQFKSINTWVLGVHWLDRIERITFENGQYFDEAEIMRQSVADAKSDGEDAIWGFHFGDRMDGGLGDDFLAGGSLGDTYVFSQGYGHDVIEDNLTDFLSESFDTLDLTDIRSDEVELLREDGALTVSLRSTLDPADMLTLNNQFQLTSTVLFGDYYYDNIDEIRFADGARWSFDDLAERFLDQASTDGDDTIYGFDRADVLTGGLGDDRLEGGVYSDTYIYARGDGHDTIYDASNHPLLAPGYDALELGDIILDDIVFARDGETLTFELRDGSGSITLESQWNRAGRDGQPNAVEEFRFADGAVVHTDLNPEDIDHVGTDGNDTLVGTDFAETIDGRGGDDLLIGASDGDTYLFDAGYGDDVIEDTLARAVWNGDDKVLFGDDITVGNIRFSKEDDDLVVTIENRDDSLRIRDQFLGPATEVELFEFADGTLWTMIDIEELLSIAGGSRGDDVIESFGRPDGAEGADNILDGRQGDDQLIGSIHSDTYLFGAGYGIDTITEVLNSEAADGAVDRVVFGALLAPEDFDVTRDAGDAVLSILGAGDQLRVIDGLDQRIVERYEFADGTVWTFEQLRLEALRGSDGDDSLVGFDDSNDTLDGGRGSDELEGRKGDDLYRFDIGYGLDAIADTGGNDTLAFGEFVTPDLLDVRADGDDLVLGLIGFDDVIVIRDSLGLADGDRRIETFTFGDGGVMTFAQMRQAVVSAQATENDDVVTGWADAGDLMAGGPGADVLRGLGGGDLYEFSIGDGEDIIDDQGATAGDVLRFVDLSSAEAIVLRAHPTRDDVLFRFAGRDDEVLIEGGLAAGSAGAIEQIEFSDQVIWTIEDLRARVLADAASDGDDILEGFSVDDRLEGGPGDDLMDGRAGSDVYRFTRGDGRDVIDDSAFGSRDVDRLEIRGYQVADVVVRRLDPEGNELRLTFAETDDEIILRNQFSADAGRGLEEVAFGDGTVWTRDDLVALISEAGTEFADSLEGAGGDDTLIGLAGDDTLSGRGGADVYVHEAGDGDDRIVEGGDTGSVDVLDLRGVDPDDVEVRRALDAPDDLLVERRGGEVIRVVGGLSGNARNQIEEVRFDDGTVWTLAEIRVRLVDQQSTDGDDRVIGFSSDDTLAGGPGDDSLSGGDGSDVYRFEAGDGEDRIEDKGGRDTDALLIVGHDPADARYARAIGDADTLVVTFAGAPDRIELVGALSGSNLNEIEEIRFDADGSVLTIDAVKALLVAQAATDGDDRIEGTEDVDTLEGGTGDDFMSGGAQSDVYLWSSGDGDDVIFDDGNGAADVLRLTGVALADLRVARPIEDLNDAVLTFVGQPGSVRIVNAFAARTADTIETVELDGGASLTVDELLALALSAETTAGGDVLLGTPRGETLDGGPGDDVAEGGGGADTYVFEAGDGRLTIREANGFNDVLEVRGIALADAVFSTPPGRVDDLVISLPGGDEIRLPDSLNRNTGLEAIIFVQDGATLTNADIRADLLAGATTADGDRITGWLGDDALVGGAGDDRLIGRDGADTLNGGTGDDYASGGGGDDLYLFGAGDGRLTIQDGGFWGGNALSISGHESSDAIFARNDPWSEDLRITFAGASDEVLILNTLGGNPFDSVAEIRFADGVTIAIGDVAAEDAVSTTVSGDGTAETFDSQAENELFEPGNGDDIVRYARGSGEDAWSDSGGNDTIELVGIDESDVVFRANGTDLTLEIAESAPGIGDSGRIFVRNGLSTGASGLENLVFGSGETLSGDALRAEVLARQATSGDDLIEGFAGADTLAGGPGADVLEGGDGDDVHEWRRGDGDDVFVDARTFGGTGDVLRVIGVDPADVAVARRGADAVLIIAESAPGAGDGGVATVSDFLDRYFQRGVESIEFDDATVWTPEALRARVLSEASTDGGDELVGFVSADTFQGGPGRDFFDGNQGDDVYLWARGDGDDRIAEPATNDGFDRLILTDADPADVTLERNGDALVVIVAESAPGAGDGGRIALMGSVDDYFSVGVEEIEFQDATVWDRAEFRAQLMAAQLTAGDDAVIGFDADDTIEGGPGDDALAGGLGSDVYVWRRGDGDDDVSDPANNGGAADELRLIGVDPADVTLSPQDDDVVLEIAGAGGGRIVLRQTLLRSFDRGVERIAFDDGTVWTDAELRVEQIEGQQSATDDTVQGFDGEDVFEGGPGDDLLIGERGSDLYRWRRGDGDDVIDELNAGGVDVLRLIGIDPADVRLARQGDDDLLVIVAGSAPGDDDGGRLIVKNGYAGAGNRGVEVIRFDGDVDWPKADFPARALVDAATDGPDLLVGGAGDDVLGGGRGDDRMRGLAGADVYAFEAGDGADVIEDDGDPTGEDHPVDVLEIRGIASSDARFLRLGADADDLIVRLPDGDSVLIVNGLAGGRDAVEEVRFTLDGATVTLGQIADRLVGDLATDGDDLILGSGAADVLTGGAGFDILEGQAGDDLYIYRAGDGIDRFEDDGGDAGDVLQIEGWDEDDLLGIRRSPPDGLDLVLSFGDGGRAILRSALASGAAGIDVVRFASTGTEWTMGEVRARLLADAGDESDERILGFDGDDTLTGGAGEDELRGGRGEDLYRYARGDGADLIEDDGRAGETDRLEIIGYASTEVAARRFYKGDDGVVLSFAGIGDTLTILNTLDGGADGIEEIVFADGVTWEMSDVLDALDNDAPVAVRDGFFSAVQGQAGVIEAAALTRNDFDPEGEALTVVSVGMAQGGTVRLTEAGDVEFTPDADATGVASFDYTVSDGRNGLATTTASLRVRPAATAIDDEGLTVEEERTLVIDAARLLANDIDGDRLFITQVKDAVNGEAALSTATDAITFTPDPGFVGEASFVYVANTPEGGRAEARVVIEVTEVNDDPTARPDALVTDENVALEVLAAELLANDDDPEGDALTITSVEGAVGATAELIGTLVRITPELDFFGTAIVSYEISDGRGGTAASEAFIEVRPANSAPVLQDDARVTNEDTPLFFSVAELLENDSDPEGDPLEVTRVFAAQDGRATLFANGTVLFEPDADFDATASFRYEASDGQGGVASAEVTVEIAPFNDPPRAFGEGYGDTEGGEDFRAFEDEAILIDAARLLANDRDPEGEALTLATVSSSVNGVAELSADGTSVTFTPDADFWGEASFRYVARDGSGGIDDARVTLYFDPTGDAPPVAGDDEVATFEDVTTVIPMALLLANDTDIDRDPLEVVRVGFAGASERRKGEISFDAAGDLVLSPTDDFNGTIRLIYTVTDNADGEDTGAIIVDVASVNDLPVAGDDAATGSRGAPLVLRIADLLANDDDPADFEQAEDARAQLSFAEAINPSNGSVALYGDEFIVVETEAAFSGELTLDVVIEDGDGGRDTGLTTAQIAAARATTLVGSEIRDLLIGSAEGERIEGLEGEDDLFGRAGADVLAGGDDADLLDGGDGVDTADYSASNIGVRADLLARIGQGGHAQGDEYVSIENLTGSAFADQLFGTLAANRLAGGDGDDQLEGLGGLDRLEGGDGDDRLDGGLGADVLIGGDGRDAADYSDSASGVTVNLAAGTGAGGEAEGDALSQIEDVIGSIHADALTGDGEDNRLFGGRGADRLIGGNGDDTLEGGRGPDDLRGGDGSDWASYRLSLGGVAVDLANQSAGGGDAAGDAFRSIENIAGSFHDDVLRGDAASNTIRGGEGADVLNGRGGIDWVDYSDSASGVTVDLGAGTGAGGAAEGDVLSNFEGIVGSAYDDALSGGAGSQTFDGGFGEDVFAGGAGGDVYLLKLDGARDRIEEDGAAGDVDVVRVGPGIAEGDVSVVRLEGGGLLLEVARDDGFLIDSLTVADHFAGPETGVERVEFAGGKVWDRAAIEARARDDVFQAMDDVIRFADEDVVFEFDPYLLTRNDTPSRDESIQVISVAPVTGGNVGKVGGLIRFVPDADFNGDAFFDYTASDGVSEITARAEVVVRPVNDAPVAADDGPFMGDEDEFISIAIADLLANDFDVDGDDLRIIGFGKLREEDGTEIKGIESLLENATNGNATFDFFGPNVIFKGSGDHFGAAGFSYVVGDGQGGTDTANVEIELAAVNDAPRPQRDAFTTRFEQTLLIDPERLIRNDVDPEDHALTLISVGGADEGVVQLAGGGVIFTPSDDFLGEAGFTYVVEDELGERATGRVEVQVIPLNDPPRAGNDRFETVEDKGILILASQLLSNDSDPNDDELLIVELDLYPENGEVSFTEAGDVIFAPKANYNGDASFFYTIADPYGMRATGEVFIDVLAENDIPFVAPDGPFTVEEDQPLLLSAFELFANDGDPDGDVLQFGRVEADNGSVRRVGENLVFTPAQDYVGAAEVRYWAVDGKGGESLFPAPVEIEITAAPDAPTARGDRVDGFEGTSTAISFAQLLANDGDGDGDRISVFSVDLDAPANGTLSETADGLIYTPEAGFWGEDAFTYVIEDAGGLLSEAATVTVDVAPDNAAPVTGEDRYASDEDVPIIVDIAELLANDADPDGDALTLVDFDAVVENGRAARLPGDRLSFAPEANVNGEIVFTYAVTDGITDPVEGRVTIDFAPVNDAPTPRDDFGFRTQAGVAIAIDPDALLANDAEPEGQNIFFVGVSEPLGGSVEVVDEQIVFTPAGGFSGNAAFTYTVRDFLNAEASAQVSVGVDVFTALDDAGFQTQEDTRLTLTEAELLGNDLFGTGGATILWVDYAVGGAATQLQPGVFAFDPGPDFAGEASFRYRAADDSGAEDEALVRITVAGVNDAPVFEGLLDDVFVGELEAIFVPAPVVTDAEGGALTFFLRDAAGGAAPDWLSVDAATGAMTGTPPRGADGIYALELVASDGLLEAATPLVVSVADVAGDVVTGTDEGEPLDGTALPDLIEALAGDDVVAPGEGADVIALGLGADEVRGDAAALAGDLITDFTRFDSIVFEGESFDAADVTAIASLPAARAAGDDEGPGALTETTLSIAGLSVDGSPFFLRLGGDLTGRAISTSAEGGSTRLTIANGAPVLPQAAAVVAHFAVVSGDLLAGASDPDGDALTLTSVDGADVTPAETRVVGAGAELTVQADGTWSLDPAGAYDGLRQGESAELRIAYAVGDGADETEGELVVTIAGSAQGRREVGDGADERLVGTAKEDDLNGAGGNDRIFGLEGGDALRGGGGKDRIKGGGGADVMGGDGGADRLDGGGGPDDLFGGGKGDRLFGGAGADELRGGGGRDALYGGNGGDKLIGDGGHDLLDGGRGKDVLTGRGGRDTFHFNRGDGADVVTDWQDGRDRIEIGRGANKFKQLDIDQKGKHALVEYGRRGDVIKIKNTDADDLDASDFIF